MKLHVYDARNQGTPEPMSGNFHHLRDKIRNTGIDAFMPQVSYMPLL